MKVRQGFVSNSSSSSFVVLGFIVNAEDFEEELDKLFDEGFEYLETDNENIVGIELPGAASDEDLSTKSIKPQEFLKKLNDAEKKLRKRFGKDVNLKIYYGFQSC